MKRGRMLVIEARERAIQSSGTLPLPLNQLGITSYSSRSSSSSASTASRSSGSMPTACGSMAQPLSPLKPSAHQPSSTLRLSTPLAAAFCPEVALASIGYSGLFSQTSTPVTSRRARVMP